MEIPSEIKAVISHIIDYGGTPCIVGGAVRDHVMGIIPKDYDIEVYDILPDELFTLLQQHGYVDVVGRSFGIFKFVNNGQAFDFSVPRKDSKIGMEHTDFEVTTNPFLSFEEAAKRRDLTMNSLIYDIKTDSIIDPFNGLSDMYKRMIVHTDNATFGDDPLRVLRIFQFAGRFDMDVNVHTSAICMDLRETFDSISKDRVWIEWEKWALKSVKPSKGLNFLWQSGWTDNFPEIATLAETEQEPDHHPEGNVFKHTMFVCDAMARLFKYTPLTDDQKVVLMLAALCHDFGKPATTEYVEGKGITAYGHDVAGEEPTRSFLERIGAPKDIIERVVPLVVNHMQHVYFGHMLKTTDSEKAKQRFVRRLATKVNIEELSLVAEADHSGRPPIEPHMPESMYEILEIAESLGVEDTAPKPILMGRHLIEQGIHPGRTMGEMLKAAFEAQLDGKFDTLEGAIEWFVGEYMY